MLLFIVFLVGCKPAINEERPPPQTEEVVPQKTINQEFDIPSLIGKSPTEIKEILGEPTSEFPPSNVHQETNVYYEKEFFELQMDYLDNKVVKMFLCMAKSTAGTNGFIGTKNSNDLLIGGNLKSDATEYSLREVTALADPTLYLCVDVIQK